MKNVGIRFANEDDVIIMLEFIKKLAEYEKMSDQVIADEALLREWIFEKKKAEVIFATEDEKEVYKVLSRTMLKPISEIAPYVPFGKSKTTQLLKDMGQKGVVTVDGKGRGTKYIIR